MSTARSKQLFLRMSCTAIVGGMLAMSISAFAATNARIGVITGENVSMRKEASTESERIEQIAEKGTKVLIIDSSGSFYKVKYQGSMGYITDEYLVAMSSKSAKVKGDYVSLREKASTESDRITTLDDRMEVSIFGEADGFYLVTVDDQIGYISTDYVSKTESSSSSKSEKSDSKSEKSTVKKNYSRKTEIGNYDDDELYLVAKLIYAEGKDQSSAGFEAMASAIYNRLVSKKFPSSLGDIVYQSNQFTVVNYDDFEDLKPNSRAIAAVEKVFLEGELSLPSDVMYFKSARLSKDWGSREYYDSIAGNMYYS